MRTDRPLSSSASFSCTVFNLAMSSSARKALGRKVEKSVPYFMYLYTVTKNGTVSEFLPLASSPLLAVTLVIVCSFSVLGKALQARMARLSGTCTCNRCAIWLYGYMSVYSLHVNALGGLHAAAAGLGIQG